MVQSESIADVTEALVADLEYLEEWADRYSYLIDMGRELAPYPDELRTREYLVKGCQSQVWIHARKNGDVVEFQGDSDAMITKGLLAMMIRLMHGQSPAAIVQADLGFLEDLGLQSNLSPTRANGLSAMIERMKREALLLQEKT